MRPLSNAALLAVWESVSARSAAERALSLLATAEPHAPAGELAHLSVGQRDVRLFELRAQMFGERMEIVGDCPRCASPFELQTRAGNLLLDERRSAGGEREEIDAAGVHVTFRLPDSTDLAAAARSERAPRLIFERCVVEAMRDGVPVAAEELSADVARAIGDRIRELDPQCEVELALTCPACGHRWSAIFDIASYFWTEIAAFAVELMQDVHVLAHEYGWSEADILAMSERRRRLYLEMAAT